MMDDILPLAVEGLSHDGRGVARHDGRVVLVRGALPGQSIRARIVRGKARLLEAIVCEELDAPAHAAPPICPHAPLPDGSGGLLPGCGGCPLQRMQPSAQLVWKRRLALDALSRIGRLDAAQLEELMPLPAPSPLLRAFRNKMEFAFGCDPAGRLILGQRERGGLGVTATPHCAILPDAGRSILPVVEALVRRTGLAPYVPPPTRPSPQGKHAGYRAQGRDHQGPQDTHKNTSGFWRFLTLRQGWQDGREGWWAILLTSPGSVTQRAVVRTLAEKMLEDCPHLSAVIHEERRQADALCQGQERVFCLSAGGMEPDAANLTLPLGGLTFRLDAASFFQINSGAAELLVAGAQTMLPMPQGEESLLDMYCGVGAPGLLLAGRYASLLGVEYDARAVRAARHNAMTAGFSHCRHESGDAGRLLQRLLAKGPTAMARFAAPFRTVLADPPRAGIDQTALQALLELGPEHILYISCNPATLARDAASLASAYHLEALAGVDLFPHTPHLECLSLWRRIGAEAKRFSVGH